MPSQLSGASIIAAGTKLDLATGWVDFNCPVCAVSVTLDDNHTKLHVVN